MKVKRRKYSTCPSCGERFDPQLEYRGSGKYLRDQRDKLWSVRRKCDCGISYMTDSGVVEMADTDTDRQGDCSGGANARAGSTPAAAFIMLLEEPIDTNTERRSTDI